MAPIDALMQLAHHTGALLAANANKNGASVPMVEQITTNNGVFPRISFYRFGLGGFIRKSIVSQITLVWGDLSVSGFS